MTKQAALHSFLNSAITITPRIDTEADETLNFLPFYPVGNVPDYARENFTKGWSYGTYTPIFDSFGGSPVSITINIWAYTSLEKPLNDAANALSQAVGYGGKAVPCDGGFIWFRRGSPFVQNLIEDDDNIKRRYINLTAEYMTADN